MHQLSTQGGSNAWFGESEILDRWNTGLAHTVWGDVRKQPRALPAMLQDAGEDRVLDVRLNPDGTFSARLRRGRPEGLPQPPERT